MVYTFELCIYFKSQNHISSSSISLHRVSLLMHFLFLFCFFISCVWSIFCTSYYVRELILFPCFCLGETLYFYYVTDTFFYYPYLWALKVLMIFLFRLGWKFLGLQLPCLDEMFHRVYRLFSQILVNHSAYALRFITALVGWSPL